MLLTANEYIQKLTVGCDVDWLKTGDGRYHYQQTLRTLTETPAFKFKQRGFNHVRLRITEYDLDSIIPEIETCLLDCLYNGMIPVLAFQGQRFKNNPNEETLLELIDWWTTIALTFKDMPQAVSYNLLIETTDSVRNNPAILNDFYARCAKKIRTFDDSKIMIVPPCDISSPDRLKDLLVPEGCAVESHFYASGMSRTQKNKLWTTGTDAEKKLVLDKIKSITSWREATGTEVWVGAIMFSDFNKDGDSDVLTSSYTIEEQANFAKFVCDALKTNKIPFSINSDTKYYDRINNSWLTMFETVLNAVIN